MPNRDVIRYRDFNIRIEGRGSDGYEIGVESPAGDGSSTLTLRHDLDEILGMLQNLGQVVRSRSGGEEATAPVGEPEEPTPRDLGAALFDDLFHGNTRRLFDRSKGMADQEQEGLRIKLHVDPKDPEVMALAGLPWELLCEKETGDFLSLSRFTPVVRYLAVPQATEPMPLEPPLKVLVVVSSPAGVRDLKLDRERSLIEDSWGGLTDVQVDFLEKATLGKLSDKLSESRYHVLHFMGHGDFEPESGRGVLLMEDEEGELNLVEGESLGILLNDARSLRLVFLNACKTAQVTSDEKKDPFAGVATALVMKGVPAVVAMQFPISDDAAIAFSGCFYSRLVQGFPVDAAVAEGRKAIRMASPESLEWATPVLFMRSADGVLFDVAAGESNEPEVAATRGETAKAEPTSVGEHARISGGSPDWRAVGSRYAPFASWLISLSAFVVHPLPATILLLAAGAISGWSLKERRGEVLGTTWPAWVGVVLAGLGLLTTVIQVLIGPADTI